MSVYVDDMEAPYGRLILCHMVADTDEEMHQMADAIGVDRKWYQKDHYDVCKSMRARAISLGAIEVTWMQLGRMVIKWRRERAERKLNDGKTD